MKTVFALLLAITSASSDSGFYFPDQISAHAGSQSEAGVDGYGNANSKSQGQASIQSQGNTGFTGNPHAPPGQGLYQSQFGQGHGQVPGGSSAGQGYGHNNYQETGPGYAHQGGHPGGLNSNAQSQSSAQGGGNGGLTNAQSNAQSQNSGGFSQTQSASQSQSNGFNSKGYPVNSVSGSTSGSQTNGQGVVSSASAASAASTTFVDGIPIASASAAAAAASAGPGGSSASSANSAAISSGFGGFQGRPSNWYLGGRMGEDSEADSDSVSSRSESSEEAHHNEETDG